MDKHLPVILFVICVAIALTMAWTAPLLWPAALAIAISGAALAMAMRFQSGDSEIADLMDDVAELRQADKDLRAELANARSMIDELAEVAEQIAAVAADGRQGAAQADIESLRVELGAMRIDMAPDETIPTRLQSLETRLAAVAATPAPSAQTPPERSSDSETLRSLIANGKRRPEPVAQPAETQPQTQSRPSEPVTLTPIFTPELGAPVAFVVGTQTPESIDAVPGLLRHAAQIAGELESAGRDVSLFVRLSGANLAHLTVRRDILAQLDSSEAFRKRLVLLTPQQGFDVTAQNTLSAVAEHGSKFAMDGVGDWSINLAALSRAGLGWIIVDGLAMARSAKDQGGDPRRLAQALGAHKIRLIAGSVKSPDDMEAIRTLEPVLVMGDGLGSPRALDETV